MSLATKISHEVYLARTRLGLTQQAVADAVSISVRWYQYIENDSHMPSADLMLRLIFYLGIDINVFRDEVNHIVSVSSN